MNINLKLSVYEIPWVLTQRYTILQRAIQDGELGPQELNDIERHAEKAFKADCCQVDEKGAFLEGPLISTTSNSEVKALKEVLSRMVDHLQNQRQP